MPLKITQLKGTYGLYIINVAWISVTLKLTSGGKYSTRSIIIIIIIHGCANIGMQ